MNRLALVALLATCGAIAVSGKNIDVSFVGPNSKVEGDIRDVVFVGANLGEHFLRSSQEKGDDKDKRPTRGELKDKRKEREGEDEEIFRAKFDSQGCAKIDDLTYCGDEIALYRVHVDGNPVPPAASVPGAFRARRLSVTLSGICKSLVVGAGNVSASEISDATVHNGKIVVQGNVGHDARVVNGKLVVGGDVKSKVRPQRGKTEITGVAEGAHVGSMENVKVAEVINEGEDDETVEDLREALEGMNIKVQGVAEGARVGKIQGLEIAGVRVGRR
jgi:hypothetical protein